VVVEGSDGLDSAMALALRIERRHADRIFDHGVIGEECQPTFAVAALDSGDRPHRHVTRWVRRVLLHPLHRSPPSQKIRELSRLRKKPCLVASLVQVMPACSLSQTIEPWRDRWPYEHGRRLVESGIARAHEGRV